MRIGGNAHYYAEIVTKDDVEHAQEFAIEHRVPLIVLGGGSNTIFADKTIEALIVRLKNTEMKIDGNTVTVHAGKNLAMLINELADEGLDLSPLTGIPGTLGGAIVGSAGQGPEGIWIDQYIDQVLCYHVGEWKMLPKEACSFDYRESIFKEWFPTSPIVWEVVLHLPSGKPQEIKDEVQRLLKVRIETQPHVKTSGSCFKAYEGAPAWKHIDAAGLRGKQIGGAQISEKHANFLINTGDGTFEECKALVQEAREGTGKPLNVEMRFIEEDGSLVF